MDLLIFSGQSNMQGQTEGDPLDAAVKRAWEYKLLSDTLVPLKNPVGEDVEELLLASHLGHGSLIPYFVDAYVKESGREVLAVHTAKGATVAADWQKETEVGRARYAKMLEKISGAKKKVQNIGKTYFIWLQGESDALAHTDEKTYTGYLMKLKNDLKKDVGIDKFMVIEVGYFASNFGGEYWDQVIQNAQERLCVKDEDFLLLTDVTKTLSRDQNYINPNAVGHYNNAAMKIIGEQAGTVAGAYRKLQSDRLVE